MWSAQDQAELCRSGILKVWKSREGTLREGPQTWKLQMLGVDCGPGLEGDMVGGGQEGWIVGKFCENWEANDLEAWENGRS